MFVPTMLLTTSFLKKSDRAQEVTSRKNLKDYDAIEMDSLEIISNNSEKVTDFNFLVVLFIHILGPRT